MIKRALLFSGGIDKRNNRSAYANDLSFAHRVLTEKMGFNADDVEILYAYGADIPANGGSLKTARATKRNFQSALLKQTETLQSGDVFLLMVTNHGFEGGSICAWGAGTGNWLTRVETVSLLDRLNCVKLVIMGQCYGGDYTLPPLIDNAVIISANKPGQPSYIKPMGGENVYPQDNCNEFICNFFSYYNGSLPSGKELSAGNKNKTVTSAFEYARVYDSLSILSAHKSGFVEEPCISVNLHKNEDARFLTFA